MITTMIQLSNTQSIQSASSSSVAAGAGAGAAAGGGGRNDEAGLHGLVADHWPFVPFDPQVSVMPCLIMRLLSAPVL